MVIGMFTPLCSLYWLYKSVLASSDANLMVFHRSPSPPPQYDNHGRRINTREYRYRKRLEDERHKLVEKAMKTIPNYHPPQDYRRPTKTQEKVYVPVNDYPEINFSMIANPLTLTTNPLRLSFNLKYNQTLVTMPTCGVLRDSGFFRRLIVPV